MFYKSLHSDWFVVLDYMWRRVTEWLTPQTPHLEVRGSSLARHIVSLDKELYSTLPLFTQLYKMGTSDILLGGNPAMD